eukprot:6293227-Alexandrium_andersonii.AAC.1
MEEDLQPRRDDVYCISVPGAQSQTASSTGGVGAEAGDGPEHCCVGLDSDADDCGDMMGERDPWLGPPAVSQGSLEQSMERCVERGPG